jgi:YbgC/YbaW family acyl-CoA thioester hydrolase
MRIMQRVLETIVQWGDCDEQGIVFYPRYFYWMDCGFQGLLRPHGWSQRALRKQFGVLGTPLVRAEADFVSPVSYEAPLTVEAAISRWGGSSFEVAYRGLSDGAVVFNGAEVRVWLVPGDDKPRGSSVAQEFRAALGPAVPRQNGR